MARYEPGPRVGSVQALRSRAAPPPANPTVQTTCAAPGLVRPALLTNRLISHTKKPTGRRAPKTPEPCGHSRAIACGPPDPHVPTSSILLMAIPNMATPPSPKTRL